MSRFRNVVAGLLALWAVLTVAMISREAIGHAQPAIVVRGLLTFPWTWGIEGARCEVSAPYFPMWNSDVTITAGVSCSVGSNVVLGQSDFDDGSQESLQTSFRLPADWSSSSAVDLVLTWRSTATTGNVVWQFATACVAVGEALDPAFNTAQTVTDATQGTASRMNTATITPITVTGCAAGEMFYFRLLRNPAHASDTLGATASLVYIDLTFRRAMQVT